LKMVLNDAGWSSELARANGLRELALLQLGTAGVLDEKEFTKRVVLLVINKYLHPVLRKVNLNQEADACEQAKNLDTAYGDAATYDAASVASYITNDNYKTLLSFAKDVAGILIDMKVPGVQWLGLLVTNTYEVSP
jgi:hypothetical protein